MVKKKDWRGGSASVFKPLGASNHTEADRAHADYYATEPKATEWLLKLEQFDAPILEPALTGFTNSGKFILLSSRHFPASSPFLIKK